MTATGASDTKISNIVLVHGAFVDGSSWQAVHRSLSEKGYAVRVVQNSTQSLSEDVENTLEALSSLTGKTLLVGHSYGGAVITNAGHHADVAGLVYVAALVPDVGESVAQLISTPPQDAPKAPLLEPINGKLYLDATKFAQAFAADISASQAAFMADSQSGFGLKAINEKTQTAAWKDKPSWYLITQKDNMVPVIIQHNMAKKASATKQEVNSSHAVMLSNPHAVVNLIMSAVKTLESGSNLTSQH